MMEIIIKDCGRREDGVLFTSFFNKSSLLHYLLHDTLRLFIQSPEVVNPSQRFKMLELTFISHVTSKFCVNRKVFRRRFLLELPSSFFEVVSNWILQTKKTRLRSRRGREIKEYKI